MSNQTYHQWRCDVEKVPGAESCDIVTDSANFWHRTSKLLFLLQMNLQNAAVFWPQMLYFGRKILRRKFCNKLKFGEQLPPATMPLCTTRN